MRTHPCVVDVLTRGLDDWIQAGEVASVAMDLGAAQTAEQVRELSILVISELLNSGLMEAGDLRPSGFIPWGLPAPEALKRIETEWLQLPEGPDLGGICWLNLTEKGRLVAEEAWAGRQRT
jgi:hypothetical protein